MNPPYVRYLPNWLLRLVFASSVLLAGAAFASAAADASQALFSEPKTQAQADSTFARDPQVVRARPVDIDMSLFAAAADLPAGGAAQAVTLNLFDNVSFVAEVDRIVRTERGLTLTGRLRGVDMGQIVLVANDGIVAANITMPMARYHIRFAGNGRHEVQRINTSLFPRDEVSMPVTKPGMLRPRAGKDMPAAQNAGDDDGSVIDMMVVYSGKTRAAAGGTQGMRGLIDLAITETNQSYQNSGVTQRLRLVHAAEVDYTEKADLEHALVCISDPGDGCLDQVQALRNTYGADLVSFWVEDGGQYCGLAWLMEQVSPDFEEQGFSVVARSCATGYYTFGHELGHNMGLRHDVYVDPEMTPYPYAHGYVNTHAVNPFRTIMAYNTACEDEWKNCERLQYWSNPEVANVFFPIGNDTANDSRALNNTARTIANFRQTVAPSKAPYQGLWGISSEPGWGLNLTQHAGTIAASFYTYDDTGYPIWYQMSDCPLSGKRCVGEIYKVSGGSVPTAPWNGAALALTAIGRGTLSFYDADNVTLSFIVNGTSGYRYLNKQVFATGAKPPAIDYSDLWWNPNESGWGIALTQQYETIFASWYAYDANGKPVWYVASNCRMSGAGCSGEVYQMSGGTPFTSVWNGTGLSTNAVGTVSFAFSDASNALMSYTLNGVSGERSITRQPF